MFKKLMLAAVFCNLFVFAYSADPQSFIDSGNAKFGSDDYKGAIEDFNKADVLGSKDVVMMYTRGMAYYNLEEYKFAIENFGIVISMKSDYIGAYIGLSDSQLKSGESKAAIDKLNSVIKIV